MAADDETKPLNTDKAANGETATTGQRALTGVPRHLKPSKRAKIIGNCNKPLARATKSVKNSHTSPRAIAMAKRKLHALQLREQGYTFEQIAKHMRLSMTTVHGYVVEALREIPAETAAEVLRPELQRLDNLLSAHYEHAIDGSFSATELVLRVIEKRARLLGLFPREGQPQPLGLALKVGAGGEVPDIHMEIEFVTPKHRDDDDLVPPVRDVTPVPRVDYDQPRTELELQANKPTSVPIVGRRRGFNWE
jgi:Helix-turn-helix domain